jgi:hypothetical protein
MVKAAFSERAAMIARQNSGRSFRVRLVTTWPHQRKGLWGTAQGVGGEAAREEQTIDVGGVEILDPADGVPSPLGHDGDGGATRDIPFPSKHPSGIVPA